MLIALAVMQIAAGDVPPAVLRDLEGRWEGRLTFAEEAAADRQSIPLSVESELFGAILVRRLTFADETLDVRRASLTTIGKEGDTLFTSYAGQGGVSVTGGPAVYEERPDGWRLTVTYQGEAEGTPAAVKEVIRLEEDRLTTTVTANPQGDESDRFFFRNEIVLDRQ